MELTPGTPLAQDGNPKGKYQQAKRVRNRRRLGGEPPRKKGRPKGVKNRWKRKTGLKKRLLKSKVKKKAKTSKKAKFKASKAKKPRKSSVWDTINADIVTSGQPTTTTTMASTDTAGSPFVPGTQIQTTRPVEPEPTTLNTGPAAPREAPVVFVTPVPVPTPQAPREAPVVFVTPVPVGPPQAAPVVIVTPSGSSTSHGQHAYQGSGSAPAPRTSSNSASSKSSTSADRSKGASKSGSSLQVIGSNQAASSGSSASMGIVLYVLVQNRLPFSDKDTKQLMKDQLARNYKFVQSLTSECKDIIGAHLNPNQSTRLNMIEVFEHDWFGASTDNDD